MKKLFAILFAVALMATMSVAVFAEENETVTITVEMADSAGDGWDDQARILALSVPSFSDMEEEDILDVFTLEDGASGTQTLTIGKNQTVYFFWLFDDEGTYNYEVSFTIKRDGAAIYTHADETDECPLTNYQRLVVSDPIEPKFTTVTYSVNPAYTVTIPATVALGETATIQAENVVVPKGKQVEVALTDANGFTVATPQGAKLGYTVKNGETEVAEGDTVLTVNPKNGKTGETTLSFVAPTEIQYAGSYTGTATFTIAVKDAPRINFKFYENGANYWSGGEDYVVYSVLEGTTWGEWLASEDNVYNLLDGGNCIFAPGPAFLEQVDKEVENMVWPLVDDEIIADAIYGLGRY